ncbi:MAG: phosphomannose isomerase type II C-terminal cupin domain [Nanoarchaeota archaeon]|nr:phosphomannose isomerase type II C-terminal cupin domain [Nanoarchaeota archaeon]MBU1103486.1 phosphomannose isomerase type II C-terminal cupin domain [Nanoarchaeota archaeon]
MKKQVVKRPWGWEDIFTLNEISSVKILNVKPRQKFSLQKHKDRKEFWKILDNPAKVTIGKKTFRAKCGDEFFIPKKTLHRVEALSKTVQVLEISFGKFDEKDIVRKEDDYGRV